MDQPSDANNNRPKIPIGVPSFDKRLRGGIRPGTSILTIGPTGAGYHEFLRSAAIMHGNWQADSGLFELTYDDVPEAVRQPSEVRYITINDSVNTFRRHIHDLAADEFAYPALEHINVLSLAEEMADLGPIKPGVDSGFEYKSKTDQSTEHYERIFRRFDDLIEAKPGELVFIDSLTDFVPVIWKFFKPGDLYFIAQTLCYLVAKSRGILIAAGDANLITKQRQGLLERSFEAVLDFGWFGEGLQQRRTLTVSKFPEFWRETDTKGRVNFDLEIDRDRFGIFEIEKIPPKR
ncbi:MAG: RAD55 family ATPase [Halodesulfurarchaeum sp.]